MCTCVCDQKTALDVTPRYYLPFCPPVLPSSLPSPTLFLSLRQDIPLAWNSLGRLARLPDSKSPGINLFPLSKCWDHNLHHHHDLHHHTQLLKKNMGSADQDWVLIHLPILTMRVTSPVPGKYATFFNIFYVKFLHNTCSLSSAPF